MDLARLGQEGKGRNERLVGRLKRINNTARMEAKGRKK